MASWRPSSTPSCEWDFRLPNVVSINVSGHKYGLVYPGVGFVVWRGDEDLPEELIFHVNYLGGDMPTFTLNFSRPGNQMVGQYYNFLRLGRGRLHGAHGGQCATCALDCPARSRTMGPFSSSAMAAPSRSSPSRWPTTCPTPPTTSPTELRYNGWQVPAYTMPDDATDVVVLRIVVREGFSDDLAEALIEDLDEATKELAAESAPRKGGEEGFGHT